MGTTIAWRDHPICGENARSNKSALSLQTPPLGYGTKAILAGSGHRKGGSGRGRTSCAALMPIIPHKTAAGTAVVATLDGCIIALDPLADISQISRSQVQ
jgi:hypothetical protein